MLGEILQTNELGERCIATPDIAQGKIFIRTKPSCIALPMAKSNKPKTR
jgi:hypothetical protein